MLHLIVKDVSSNNSAKALEASESEIANNLHFCSYLLVLSLFCSVSSFILIKVVVCASCTGNGYQTEAEKYVHKSKVKFCDFTLIRCIYGLPL